MRYSSNGDPHPVDRLVRIHLSGAQFLVCRKQDDQIIGNAIPLPKFPRSLMTWLARFGEGFVQEHSRCIALTLLLDMDRGRWQTAIPDQDCRPYDVTWRLRSENYASLNPDIRVAGSFQVLGPQSLFDVSRAIPRFDGLHLIAARDQEPNSPLWVFVYHEKDALMVEPANVIADPADSPLKRYAHRLSLS